MPYDDSDGPQTARRVTGASDLGPEHHIASGARLGRYLIGEKLGAGGMGEVYRATDTRLEREVAVKVIGPGVTHSASARKRFEQEARAASALNHPNIVTIFDIAEEGGRPFIVMELLEGQSLRAMTGEPLRLELLMRFAVQIADALAAVHERGIVHRDLKPENIFITAHGAAKLLDFGIAQFALRQRDTGDDDATFEALTHAGGIVGTTGYMPPEVIAGRASDARADLFSFGCIVYEMACGARAFTGVTATDILAATLRDEPEPIARRRPDLPNALAHLIESCLQKDPELRPGSTRLVRDKIFELSIRSTDDIAPAAAPVTIPTPPTEMVGRDDELQQIRSLLIDEGARLVTLTGPGGSGKTRLGIAAAHELVGHYHGRVLFVSLATVSGREGVVAAIDKAIGNVGAARPPLVGAIAKLQAIAAPTLLVLDNFEHVIEAADLVSELLASCPLVSVLVTSREILRVYGEHDVPVPPLPLPDPEAGLAAAMTNPAVVLFADRARAASPSFQVNNDNIGAVVELCRRLDGLPLAIELAAARVRLMTPQAMLSRLGQRLNLLTGGPRDRPNRQQTLRSTLNWSHELLSSGEQTLFRRLSAFAGGFTFEAAEAVADPFEQLPTTIVDGVASLVDKSLLVRQGEHDGEPRFTILETVREYAAERLAESAEQEPTRKAHAAYFLVLAEEGAKALASADSPQWLDRLAREHDNFRSALDWLIAAKNAEWALRLAVALFPFWERSEHLSEARRKFEVLLVMPEASQHEGLRAQALFASGVLATTQFDDAIAADLFEQSLAVHRHHGNRWGVAVACNSLGIVYARLKRHDDAAAKLEEALDLWQELGDEASFARSQSNLASVRKAQQRFDDARELYAAAAGLFERVGDRTSSAWALNHQGDIAREQGDWTAAARLYEQALEAFRSLGDEWGTASCLADLGLVARHRADTAGAEHLYQQSLSHFVALGHQRGIARVFEAMAMLGAERDTARALTLAAAALRLRETVGSPGTEADHLDLLASVRSMRQKLDEGTARAAWDSGRYMTLRDAVRFARQVRA